MRETAKVNNKSNEETDRQWLTLAQLPRFSLTKLAIILQTNNLEVADLFAIDNEQLQFIGFSDVQAQRLLNPVSHRICLYVLTLSYIHSHCCKLTNRPYCYMEVATCSY